MAAAVTSTDQRRVQAWKKRRRRFLKHRGNGTDRGCQPPGRRLEEEKEEERRTAEQQRRVAEQVEAITQLEREAAEMDAAEAEAAAMEAEQQGGGGESKEGPPAIGGSSCDSGAARDAECVVCMEEARSCLFLPCRHMCVCRACADLIMASATTDCPKCRTKVEDIIDVFV